MVADGYVCKLRERFDLLPGKFQWSLPRNQICHCQAVVAPRVAGSQSCSRENDAEIQEDLWLTDDPSLLVDRKNWEPAKLDQYLNRALYCGKIGMYLFIVLL